jgi:hypothetical protein
VGLSLDGCAVPKGYKYNYNTIEFGNKFQPNLTSWSLKLVWGLDGCARWRKVTITVTINNFGIQWGRAWMAARGGARLQLHSIKLSWGVIFKII